MIIKNVFVVSKTLKKLLIGQFNVVIVKVGLIWNVLNNIKAL